MLGAFCCASWPRPLESLTQPLSWRLVEGPMQTAVLSQPEKQPCDHMTHLCPNHILPEWP